MKFLILIALLSSIFNLDCWEYTTKWYKPGEVSRNPLVCNKCPSGMVIPVSNPKQHCICYLAYQLQICAADPRCMPDETGCRQK